MYAIEFKTVVKDKYIELENIDNLINKHVRVIVLVEEEIQDIKKNESNEILLKKLFQDAENIKIDPNVDIYKISNEVNL
jgi:plasmid rolling circle replication initiator protein Rep